MTDNPTTPTPDAPPPENKPAEIAPTTPAQQPVPKWWKWAGIRRSKFKYLPIIPTIWGCLMLMLIFGGGGSAAFMEYSMQPDFCRSCHLMEPYYQAWHNSTHKMCHFEPGLENTLYGKFQASSQAAKFITRTYGSKPHAEVRDTSCMRSGCHEKRILEGKVNWTIQTSRGVPVTIRFDHTPHLKENRRGKQLRCVSCHSQIVQGQHLTVTLDTCFVCHFKGAKHGREDETVGGCKGCHDAPKAEIRLANGVYRHGDYVGRGVGCENCHSDSVKGDAAVPRQRCWDCHNQPALVSKYDDTTLVHSTHINAHKVECSACHIQIEHSLNANAPRGSGLLAANHLLENAGACAQCHEQSHNGPAELYRGTGGRGVPDMPSPMFRTHVNCIACHQQKEKTTAVADVTGQTYRATQERCNFCHGEKYTDLLKTWKTGIEDHLARAEAALNLITRRLDADNTLSEPGKLSIQRLLDDAQHNVRLVRLGHGVHNVTYATALLNLAMDRCKEADSRLPKQTANAQIIQP